jgi:hypothetical protein
MKILSSTVLCLVIAFSLSSCGFIIKSVIKKDNENVPVDFQKDKTPVLIVKWKKKVDKKVEGYFKQYYKGEYLVVSNEELQTKYSDLSKYRYLFSSTRHIHHYENLTPGQPGTSAAGLSFNLYDRQKDSVYDTGVESGTSWKLIAKTYIKKLDQTREKNLAK